MLNKYKLLLALLLFSSCSVLKGQQAKTRYTMESQNAWKPLVFQVTAQAPQLKKAEVPQGAAIYIQSLSGVNLGQERQKIN